MEVDKQPEYFKGDVKTGFTLTDINKDDKITRKEMNVAHGLHHKFDDFDTDNNKFISLLELNNILPWFEVLPVMDKWDKNKDKQLNF